MKQEISVFVINDKTYGTALARTLANAIRNDPSLQKDPGGPGLQAKLAQVLASGQFTVTLNMTPSEYVVYVDSVSTPDVIWEASEPWAAKPIWED